MPVIATVDGIKIMIYYNDHDPPHFHAFQAGSEILVEIVGPRIYARRGNFPPAMERAILHWAAPRGDKLAMCWARARAAVPPGKIV